MENNPNSIGILLEKAELYGRTSIELFKNEAILKSAEVFSSLAAKLAVITLFLLFSLFLNIGLALWIGDYLESTYYGFFVVAIIYLFFAILFYVFRNNLIKNPVCNYIIVKLQKKEIR